MLDSTNSLLPGNVVTIKDSYYAVQSNLAQITVGTFNVVGDTNYVLDHVNNIYIIKYV